MSISTRPMEIMTEHTTEEIRLEALASKGRVRNRLRRALERHAEGRGSDQDPSMKLAPQVEALRSDPEHLSACDDLLEAAPLN